MKKAYLGGGCFWGMEYYLKKLEGVAETSVGFMGGDDTLTSYDDVKMGNSGHAEIVEVVYNELKLSFKDLILYFFRLHDPTTKNRQHNDIGTQYRSAIFTSDNQEVQAAQEIIEKLNDAQIFDSKIVTKIEPMGSYHRASEEHQDYLQKHPNGYNCHSLNDEFHI